MSRGRVVPGSAAPALESWKRLVPALAEDGPRLLGRAAERAGDALCPPGHQVFRALELTPPEAVRVVILGQDPYHGPGQAHGLAFSVPEGVKAPPSLRNVLKEALGDGAAIPTLGPATDLSRWARQGVLLLNAILTTELGRAGAHRSLGWQALTDAVVRAVSESREHAVFMLWGGPAREKGGLVDGARHLVLEAVHPSPLSAWRGFNGCGHFSTANAWLRDRGLRPVDW